MTASASERRLASHLLRRQSMTLPSTVEERTTIYTHNTTYTRKIYTRNTLPHDTPGTTQRAATGFSGKKHAPGREDFESASIVTHPEFCFRGKNGAKTGRTDGRTKEQLTAALKTRTGSRRENFYYTTVWTKCLVSLCFGTVNCARSSFYIVKLECNE